MVSHITERRDRQMVFDAIRLLVRSLRESSRAAERKVGLSGAQLFVLQTLKRTGPVSLQDLAIHTATHQSSVSVVVSRLVDRSLVSRKPDPRDRRRLVLSLTASGAIRLRRSPSLAQQRLIEGLDRMSARDRRQLALLLQRLVVKMGIERVAPSMFFEEPSVGR
jgi:MarR family transcriptional regulator, lower aerobic nicotinate degradation pathway regulator